jgi:hypothetical protein
MRRMVGAAIAAGVLLGAVGAAVRADDQIPSAPAGNEQATTPVPISARREGVLPDGRLSPAYVHYRVHRPRIAVRLPDPAGGPEWAVRVFDAERVTLKKPARTLAGGRVVGRNRCVQLGRIQDGAFGWIYGDGRFRRVPTGTEYRLIQCTGRKRPRLTVTFESTLALADPADPKITGAVVWGLAPNASSVSVTGTGGADGAAEVSDDAFLKLGDASAKAAGAARVQAGGHTVRIGPSTKVPDFGGRIHITFPTPIAGTERIEARAPDPSGGPGYGLLVAQTREGVPCVGGAVQVAGDRAGSVDLRLALFTGGSGISRSACRPLSAEPDAKRPCDIGWGGGNAEELEGVDAFLQRARIERRLLAGRTEVYGQCSADVDKITVRTPRDVRTLAPSPLGHAFLAVYDGDFPAGRLEITAQLKNGKTWTESHELGF